MWGIQVRPYRCDNGSFIGCESTGPGSNRNIDFAQLSSSKLINVTHLTPSSPSANHFWMPSTALETHPGPSSHFFNWLLCSTKYHREVGAKEVEEGVRDGGLFEVSLKVRGSKARPLGDI